jgi:hypothetical protein
MKKSTVALFAVLILLVGVCSFFAGVTYAEKTDSPQAATTNVMQPTSNEITTKATTSTTTTIEPTTESKSSETIHTDFYDITIPASWYGNYSHRVLTYGDDGSYSLYFRHDKSYAESCGGHLFTIELHPVESNYAEKLQQFSPTPFDFLGVLKVPEKGDFQVIVTYSSDVQYADKYELEYNNIRDTVDNALITIKGTGGAIFESNI